MKRKNKDNDKYESFLGPLRSNGKPDKRSKEWKDFIKKMNNDKKKIIDKEENIEKDDNILLDVGESSSMNNGKEDERIDILKEINEVNDCVNEISNNIDDKLCKNVLNIEELNEKILNIKSKENDIKNMVLNINQKKKDEKELENEIEINRKSEEMIELTHDDLNEKIPELIREKCFNGYIMDNNRNDMFNKDMLQMLSLMNYSKKMKLYEEINKDNLSNLVKILFLNKQIEKTIGNVKEKKIITKKYIFNKMLTSRFKKLEIKMNFVDIEVDNYEWKWINKRKRKINRIKDNDLLDKWNELFLSKPFITIMENNYNEQEKERIYILNHACIDKENENRFIFKREGVTRIFYKNGVYQRDKEEKLKEINSPFTIRNGIICIHP